MTPRAASKQAIHRFLPPDLFELLHLSMSGLAPQDMLTHLIDRVEGRK